MDHAIIDLRDSAAVARQIDQAAPEVIFHLAAQALVRRSYRDPVDTFATNVMGTIHLMEALRHRNAPVALVVVTTDKVYENREWPHAYRETDRLGGHDPYSASKAACELAVASYRQSFFAQGPVHVASARAGNVIGGGDWAQDRIVPDYVRAALAGQTLVLRNPGAVRPWQHVLDPLAGYMALAQRLAQGDAHVAQAFNFGPDPASQRSVADVVSKADRIWPRHRQDRLEPSPLHEATLLTLTTDKARHVLNWRPRWDFDSAMARSIGWYRAVQVDGRSATESCDADLAAFAQSEPGQA